MDQYNFSVFLLNTLVATCDRSHGLPVALYEEVPSKTKPINQI